jgi:hypothetical protein
MLVDYEDDDMTYYIAYRASNNVKNRSQITRLLRDAGCTRIHRAFWKVEENKIVTVTKILRKNQLTILRRKREIERPSYTNDGKLRDLGSLIIIAYQHSQKDRMKIDAFVRRAPCIRIRRGVYAFSQWHPRFDKERQLVDARSFWRFICQIDEDAIAIPRLIIDNPASHDTIVSDIEKRIQNEIAKIMNGHLILYQNIAQGKCNREYALNTARKLRKRFTTVKRVASFYEKWLKLKLSHLLLKPYPPMRKVNALLEEKYEVAIAL